MCSVNEILGNIPSSRSDNLFSSPACKMSEGRHIENLAYCAKGAMKLNVRRQWIKSENSLTPVAWAKVITKPTKMNKWEGKETSIVLSSEMKPDLEGMIIDKNGLPLRPLYFKAIWPSVLNYPSANDEEGLAVSSLVSEIGFRSFEIDDEIMYLLPLLMANLNIVVGNSFYENIQTFTDYRRKQWKNPWES